MNGAAMMPAVFIGHGSPMNTLEQNRYTSAWAELGASLPPPRAILSVSAHWFIGYTAVTAMERPRVIHDFFGFPDELANFDYPAPGAPDVAAEVAEVVKPRWMGLDQDSWGLDHGTWSVLAHMYPRADVPVVQLSLDANRPFDSHLDLAARLAPLRRQGVLVVASGNIVHNLRRVDWANPSGAYDWAERFDEAARERMVTDPASVLDLQDHSDFRMAVPTPDHFLPLVYFAGLAEASGQTANTLVDGYTFGSISMTSYTAGVGSASLSEPESQAPAAPLPDPDEVPPEQTNT